MSEDVLAAIPVDENSCYPMSDFDSFDSDDSSSDHGHKYYDALTGWIPKYLLKLEEEDKEPPYLAFKDYYGLPSDHPWHIEIPFKTEKFRKWV